MHEKESGSSIISNTKLVSASTILNIKDKIIERSGKRTSMCIPLMSDNIYEKGDAWRIWSCIYLAYRLRNAMDLLPNHDNRFAARWESPTLDHYKYSGGMVQRGKYLTRRKDKFWWRALRNAYCSSKDAVMSSKGNLYCHTQ